MIKKHFLFFLLFSVSFYSFSQELSLRELLLNSDIVAVIKEKPPFLPKKEIAISDYEKMRVLDSIEVISYIKNDQKGFPKQPFLIKTNTNNTFFSHLGNIVPVPEIEDNMVPKNTLIFTKKRKNFIEVICLKNIASYKIHKIENFAKWIESTAKISHRKKRGQQYIDKYISNLNNNLISEDFIFFENILSPNSAFSSYYELDLKFTEQQKKQLKNYLFNNYYDDIELTKLVFKLYPKETLNLYKIKLIQIKIEEYSHYKHDQFLELFLKKTNKWDKKTELLLKSLSSYGNDSKYLKEKILNYLTKIISN